ncbi:hypothetical protein [Nitrosomonas aestuarii]|uniref:Uncharacterized protein n=1 Tax=Nitrosomonas aestuarii TaxID=52441 RepID=A0A1I4A474_9PROT|nr:hypothetical protein [Nitrosomonas aestuarii]PTN11325.1 hypothetical protein C8R11_111105 [Nitrosomonas aestuarii]SFK50676.1 hypothetical protein SAMN05216302_10088 [Nitrosomonas aestuarii]
MKRFFLLIQILAILTPVTVFFGYIIMDEGDQFTAEHYMITGLSTLPFCLALLVKYLMSDIDKKPD